jgi:hypothetical protein
VASYKSFCSNASDSFDPQRRAVLLHQATRHLYEHTRAGLADHLILGDLVLDTIESTLERLSCALDILRSDQIEQLHAHELVAGVAGQFLSRTVDRGDLALCA